MIGAGHGWLRVAMLATAWFVVMSVQTPVFADSSGPLVEFPITGASAAKFREDRDHISVIEFAGNYDRSLSSGEYNVEPRAVVAQEFFKTHPDDYDFIVTFSGFEFDTGDALAYHWGLRNAVQGIGLPEFDISHLFGSDAKLQGYIDMAALSRWVSDPLDPQFELSLSVLAHEVLHQWGPAVRYLDANGQPSAALLGRDASHWSYLLDSDASVEYGAQWRDNGDGSFTSVGINTFYSPLDLYLMGFYSADEVPPFFLIENNTIDKTQLPQENVTINGVKQLLSIDDVIAAEGPRIPSAHDAQKTFRFAFVFLVGQDQVVSDAQILALNNIRKAFMTRFAILTGGRGIAQIYPQALPVAHVGTPGSVSGGALRADPVNYDQALAWLSGAQKTPGNWADKENTAVRDTSVALAVLKKYAGGFTGTDSALSWLAHYGAANTDSIARHAQVVGGSGADATALRDRLLSLQNLDGGWGLAEVYRSDPLDTALAVRALSGASNAASQVQQALSYLRVAQNTDGGWSGAQGGPSRASVTAQVLQAYRLGGQGQAGEVLAGLTWLATTQQADGGFGDAVSTVADTAQQLELFVDFEAGDRINAQAAADYLLGLQGVDGDWSGSVYATALALNALKRFSFSNWALDDVITIAPASPRDGERASVGVVVRNDSHLLSPQGVLRLYDGDPVGGGVVIGPDIVIPAMAGGQALSFSQLWDTFDKPGEHTLLALVDPDNAVLEMSERDNRAALSVQVRAAPAGIDLEISDADITVIPAQPNRLPTTLGINVNLRNLGLQDAAAVPVLLWQGEAGRRTLLGQTRIDVASRSSVVVNFNHVLENPGTTTLTVQLDPDNLLAEASESNNSASVQVSTVASVDLSVTPVDMQADVSPVLWGQDVTFSVTLHNNGTQQSPQTTVNYVVSDGVNTQVLRTNSISIDPGKTLQQNITWRVDMTGALSFSAQLDPNALVTELDETNNIASLVFAVGTANGPNLVVSHNDFTFAPDPAKEGYGLSLSALVRNTGNQAAANITLAFYEGDPAQGGVLLDSQVIPSLAAGAQTTLSSTVSAVQGAADKLLYVLVDPDNAILEFSETDNSAFNVLKVLSLPDLALSSEDIQLSPAFPVAGDTLGITARVANLGQQDAANVLVRAYDGDPNAGGQLIGEQTVAALAANTAVNTVFSLQLGAQQAARPIVIQIDPANTVLERSISNNVASREFVVQDVNAYVSNRYFSPNGDGIKDDTQFFFRLKTAASVVVQVVDIRDEVVRSITNAHLNNITEGSVHWDGLNEHGSLVSDGEYRLRVVDAANTALGEVLVSLDTNRSSLLKSAGTQYKRFVNLSCELPNIGELTFTQDEQYAFFWLSYDDANTPAYRAGLYRMRADGTDVRVLVPKTVLGAVNMQAFEVSADGSRLFFSVHDTAKGPQLWRVNTDGSALTLLDETHFTSAPNFVFPARDGSGVYAAARYTSQLWFFPADNPGNAQLTHDFTQSIIDLDLSSDGGAFAVALQNSGVSIYDVASAQHITLPQGAASRKFSWSPDGRRLAVPDENAVLARKIYVFDRRGQLERQIQTPDGLYISYLQAPQWMSDNAEFALALQVDVYAGPTKPGGIYLANVETGEIRRLRGFELPPKEYSYHISTWDGSAWVERGVLHYNRFYQEKTVDLGAYLPDADGDFKVRIRQTGLQAAHVESIALLQGRERFVPTEAYKLRAGLLDRIGAWFSTTPPGDDVLASIQYPDHEVLDLHESQMQVRWTKIPGKTGVSLALNAREEDLSRLNTRPFSYPQDADTGYSYRLEAHKAMVVDGFKQADDHLGKALFRRFSQPGTGHPSGFVQGYVSNDDQALYAALDFTVDNTLDGDADWAAVRVRVGGQWREFRVNVNDERFGRAGFVKTDSVGYTHKYYEFKIPLTAIDAAAGDDIELAFQAYGTAAIVLDDAATLARDGYLSAEPGHRELFWNASNAYPAERFALYPDESNRVESILPWQGSFGYNASFLPSGRALVFSSNIANTDASSSCFGKGYNDQWLFQSLLNLTADLRGVNSASASGVILRGTAADLNFDSYQLDYAAVDAPVLWRAVAPRSGQALVDDVFTTWVPPGPGTYLVRLSVRDRAGNVAQSIKRVSWSEPVSITDLYSQPHTFSPNGDGVQDNTAIHYRVLQPVHLEFTFYNAKGDLVRRIARDHTSINTEFDLSWDGRDNNGLTLPDGDYRMRVQNYEFGFVIDNSAPSASIALRNAYQPALFSDGNGGTERLVVVNPGVSWAVDDAHLSGWRVERGEGANPLLWQAHSVPGLGSEKRGDVALSIAGFVDQRYRLISDDEAGNKSIVSTPLGDEQLIIAGFGNLDINPRLARRLAGEGESLANDVSRIPSFTELQSLGGYFASLPSPQWIALADENPLALSATVEPRDVRIDVAETLRSDIRQMYIQYRAVDSTTWLETPVDTYLQPVGIDYDKFYANDADYFRTQGIAEADRTQLRWPLSGLEPGGEYALRLRAIDGQGAEHVSNAMRFAIGGYSFNGLIDEASVQDRAQVIEPQLKKMTPAFNAKDEYGLWGQEYLSRPIAEVRLYVRSTDDPRYAQTRLVDTQVYPDKTFIFRTADLSACKHYTGYIELYGEAGVDALMPLIGKTRETPFTLPCLSLDTQTTALYAQNCGDPSPNQVQLALTPKALDDVALKLLTLSRFDSQGGEDVLYNVNQPQSGVSYRYTLDTAALPEGLLNFTARLTNLDDRTVSRPVQVLVDHTPPVIDISYPLEGLSLCGVPTQGADGLTRNVMTLEGDVNEANGWHYLVDVLGTNGEQTIHDSRSKDSRQAANGNASAIDPVLADLHRTGNLSGPLAAVFDRDGELEARLRVFDSGGHQQCLSRRFYFDGQVEMGAVTVDQALFSPNNDGVLDSIALSYEILEPARVDITVYKATRDAFGRLQTSGNALRVIEHQRAVLSGTSRSVWNGLDDGGAVLADGEYLLVVQARDGCGNLSRRQIGVQIDTQAPQLQISYPKTGDPLRMTVEVSGAVSDINLQGYELAFGVGTQPDAWAPISSGAAAATGVLGNWNTFGLEGDYALRLRASDTVGNQGELIVPLTISARVDLLNSLEAVPALFSPNADGRREQSALRVGIADNVLLRVEVFDASDTLVRSLALNQSVGIGEQIYTWDGKNAQNQRVNDGEYSVRVTAALAANTGVQQQETVSVTVDTTAPALAISRPGNGFVRADGQVIGSIDDLHLNGYTLELSDNPSTPVWQPLSDGVQNRADAALGSLALLTEGEYLLRLRATDFADNANEAIVRFEIDNTAPQAAFLAPENNALLGATMAPIAVRALIEEKNLQAYTLSIGAGLTPQSWTELAAGTSLPVSDPLTVLDVSALNDGPYTLQLRVQDKAGNQDEQQITLQIDNTAPLLALTQPVGGGYVKQAIDILGSVSDSHLSAYVLSIASGSQDVATRWSELGRGSLAVSDASLLQWRTLPPDGLHTLKLTADDGAQNSAQILREVMIDTHAPAPPSGFKAQIEKLRDVRLSWTANSEPDVIGYTVYRSGQALVSTPIADTQFVDVNVGEGVYDYTVTAWDAAGWESAVGGPLQVRVDTSPPSAVLSRPSDAEVVSGLLDIVGTAYSGEDFKEYRLYVGEGAQPASWTLLRRSPTPLLADVLAQWNTLVLNEGAQFSIKLEAEDLNGNIGSDQIRVSIDNLAPGAPTSVLAVASGTDVNTSWNANTEADLLGYLLLRNDRLANANGAVVGDLRPYALRDLSYIDRALADGPYAYTVVAIDRAGNLSAPSLPSSVLIDTRAPQALITTPGHASAYETAFYVLAESEDTDIAQVQFEYRASGASAWTAVQAPDTTAPYAITLDPVAQAWLYGDYELRAVAIDLANKVDPSPSAITVRYIDLTRPAQTQGLKAAVNGAEVALTWTANSETDIAGYRLYRSEGTAAPVLVTAANISGTQFVDTTTADGRYQYTVRALDLSGNEGDVSAPATALVYTPVLDQAYTPTQGDVVDVSGRGLVAATASGSMSNTAGITALVDTVTDAHTRFVFSGINLLEGANLIALQLTDAAGNVSKTAQLRIDRAAPPSQPTGLSASALGYDVSLAWNANPESDIIGYRVRRNAQLLLTDAPITGLTADASHYPSYAGRAIDGVNSIAWFTDNRSDQPLEGQWLSVSWTDPLIVSTVVLDWLDVDHMPSDFDLEAWSGQGWVRIARIVNNTTVHNTLVLDQAYRSTQLRVLLHKGPSLPGMNGWVQLDNIALLAQRLQTGLSLNDVAPDGVHDYSLTAVNAYGFESLPSASAQVPVGDVSAPEPVSLTGGASASDVQLSWSASVSTDVNQYRIYRDGSLIHTLTDLSSLSYLDSARANASYVYNVHAVDVAGNESLPSNDLNVTVNVSVPSAPLNLSVSAVAQGGALDLAWQAAGTGAAGYRVLRSTVAGGPYSRVSDTHTLALRDTGLINNTVYYYIVRALDGVGNLSGASNEASGTAADTQAPQVSLHYPSVPGVLHITGDASTPIIGLSEAGARITLNQDGIDVATGIASAGAVQSVDLPGAYGMHAELSGDGSKIVFTSQNVLFIRSLVTGEQQQIPGIEPNYSNSAQWRADGKAVVISTKDQSSSYLLYPRLYTLGETGLVNLLDPASLSDDVYGSLLSPDQTHLAYVQSNQLWTRDLNSGVSTQLVAPQSGHLYPNTLRWSPDSKKIAYLVGNGAVSVGIVDVTSGAVRVADAESNYDRPDWSADSSSLIYIARANGEELLWHYDLAQGIGVSLFTQSGVRLDSAVFSPDARQIAYLRDSRELWVLDRITGVNEAVFNTSQTFDTRSLRWVASGYLLVGLDERLYRIEPRGRIAFKGVKLKVGDNVFWATAQDAAGNTGQASDAVVVNYSLAARPDLLISDNDIVILPSAPVAGENTRVTVNVHNQGDVWATSSGLSLFAIHPDQQSQTLLNAVPLSAIAPGGQQAVGADWTVGADPGRYTLVAIADVNDTLTEVSEVNNLAVKEVIVAADAAPLITLSTDKPAYTANEIVETTVSITNYGAQVSGRLELRVEDGAANLVETLQRRDITDLAYGQSLNINAQWNTADTFAGDYRIKAIMLDSAAQQIAQADTAFSISAVAGLSSRISTDQLQYPANRDVQIAAVVDYSDGNSLLSGAEARLWVQDVNGNIMVQTRKALGDLLPGANASLALTWNTGTAVSGTYVALVEVLRQSLAVSSAQTVFTIQADTSQVAGALTLSTSTPGVGEVVSVAYSLDNQGNQDLTQLPVILSLYDPDLNLVLQTQQTTLDIARNGAASGSALFNTQGLSLKNYRMLLQVDINQSGSLSRNTLATAGLRVLDRYPPVLELRVPVANGVVRGDVKALIHAVDQHSRVKETAMRVDNGAWLALSAQGGAADTYGRLLPLLAEGSHSIAVRATDVWNNTATTPSYAFVVDNTAPVIQISGVQDGAYVNQDVVPQIVINETHLASSSITLDGQAFVSATAVSSEGRHRLLVYAEDKAGNKTQQERVFTVDKTQPTISVSGVEDGGLYAADVTPVIVIDDLNPSTQTITLNGNAFVSGTPITQDGVYELSIFATDLAGNTRGLVLNFELDKTAPVVTYTSPLAGDALRIPLIRVEGSTEAQAVVFLSVGGYEASALADANGLFVFTQVPLTEGENTISAYARDRAGNVGIHNAIPVTLLPQAELIGELRAAQGVLLWSPRARQHEGEHHRSSTPADNALVNLVQSALNAQERDYLVVTQESEFLKALRTQRYGTVMILEPHRACAEEQEQEHQRTQEGERKHSEHEGRREDSDHERDCGERAYEHLQISEHVSDELRAMLASGTGMVWIKTHPDSNEHWQDIFGAKSQGVIPRLSAVELQDSPASVQGVWASSGSGLKLRLVGAQAVGVLQPDGKHPAMVLNAYRQGRVALVTFDPSRFEDQQGAQGVLEHLIRFAAPVRTLGLAGEPVDILWHVSKLNAPLELQFDEHLVDALRFLSARDGLLTDAQNAIWTRTLDTDSTHFKASIALPLNSGTYTVRAIASRLEGLVPFELARESLDVVVDRQAPQMGVALLDYLNALPVPTKDRDELQDAIAHIQHALTRRQQTQKDAQYAIRQLLEASEELRDMSSDSAQGEAMLGELVRSYQLLWSRY